MPNNEHAIQEAMRLAATPEGKQLIAKLKEQGGADLEQALRSGGNYAQAIRLVRQLSDAPEIRQLLERLGR